MMRFLRIFSVLLTIAAVFAYGGVSYYVKAHTDKNGPVIHMEEKEISVSIEGGEKEMLAGITAEDEKDGDVTDSLIVESTGAFTEKGKRQVTIAAFDSDDNVSRTVRTIIYSDYVSPRISMKAPLRAPINDIEELTEGITVTDCLDGDITGNVQITPVEGMPNAVSPGEYAMKLIVANSVGDVAEIPVTVEFYDYALEGLKPKPLLSEYLVYTKVGQPIDPMEYLTGVEVKGIQHFWDFGAKELPIKKSEIMIENPVDYDTPGVYEICYKAEDGNGSLGSVRLIVVVEE